MVDFLVGDASTSATDVLVRAAGFHVASIAGLYQWRVRPSFRQRLRDVVRRERYTVIHWFEFHDGVREAAIVAREAGCAFVWTVTSGGVPASYHGLNRVAVYTQEIAEDVRRRSPTTVPHVLPARLDFRMLSSDVRERARTTVRPLLGIAETDLLIVRVARCADVYLRSVRLGVELASRLVRDGQGAVFLHAGYEQDSAVAQDIRNCVNQANALAGRTVAHSVTDNLLAGVDYIAAADVCIASGRSALEAVALERPTIVAWGARYLGMVDAGNIARVAETNFQGRQSERVSSDEDVLARMREAIDARAADEVTARQTQSACAAFVREHYSVERAADAYEQLYADRTVNVESLFRAAWNPSWLSRELFHRLPAGVRRARLLRPLRRAWAARANSGTID